jgi:hypothetical protein
VDDAEQHSDGRIGPLLEGYCKLAKVKMVKRGPDLHELKLPLAERAHFRDRDALRVALSLEALERNPDAEIAVLGSPFLTNLVEAIRVRGGRLSLGLIPPPHPLSPSPKGRGGTKHAPRSPSPGGRGGQGVRTDLPIPLRNGTAHQKKSGLAAHPIGRLLARVVLRAGAAVEEAVVESAVVDLSTGTPAGDDVAQLFGDLEAQRIRAADPDDIPDAALVPSRDPEAMLQLLLGDLREKSAERVAARQAASEKEVTAELERLDRYFASILADKTDKDEVGTITALHERRRAEEVRRHQVKAVVHPLQLVEAQVLVQRVEWEIKSAAGRRARFAAQRPFAGSAAWTMACPQCGHPPAELVVCVHEDEKGIGHCACDACSTRCSVCDAGFCADHGIVRCRVDEQPACEEHARVCQSCRMAHCTEHEGTCAEGDHKACSACLEACGSCGRVVCNRHAEQSRPDAPKGSRRLCSACLVYCEGGTNEPVGIDEVTQCASCGRAVCTSHRSVCVVDGQVHCSRHLRHTDGSGRLVCERHRAACIEEPDAVFASDEVGFCASCGKLVCAAHSGECVADNARHCVTHLEPLRDASGSSGCGTHRKTCHVDGGVFSLDGARTCPVCGKDACAEHRAACSYCGRQVCTADVVQGSSLRCTTCAQLVANGDPPVEAVAAMIAAMGDESSSRGRRAWRMARDRTHLVVELDLGWRRRTVFTLRHGETEPESVVTHSLVGSRKKG